MQALLMNIASDVTAVAVAMLRNNRIQFVCGSTAKQLQQQAPWVGQANMQFKMQLSTHCKLHSRTAIVSSATGTASL
jgi:hypothetical protein